MSSCHSLHTLLHERPSCRGQMPSPRIWSLTFLRMQALWRWTYCGEWSVRVAATHIYPVVQPSFCSCFAIFQLLEAEVAQSFEATKMRSVSSSRVRLNRTLGPRHGDALQSAVQFQEVSPLLTLYQLVFHPEHRITVDEALEHAYLADLHGQVSQQGMPVTLKRLSSPARAHGMIYTVKLDDVRAVRFVLPNKTIAKLLTAHVILMNTRPLSANCT